MFFSRIDSSTRSMSAQKKARGLPGIKEGPLVHMLDRQRVLLPDLVILIVIEGVQWLETATCERGFSLRTQILTAQRHRMGDSDPEDEIGVWEGSLWVFARRREQENRAGARVM